MLKRRLLGKVGVDSGMLRIIDPCYDPDETYDDRLERDRFPSPYIEGREDEVATTVSVKPLGVELGLDITGWGGDGMFPVTALVDATEGLVHSVTIWFSDDAEVRRLESQ